MIRMFVFIILVFSAMAMPVMAGGADDDVKKEAVKTEADHAIPPVSAGGAEAPPVGSMKNTPSKRREVAITTAPMLPLTRKVTVLIESEPASSGIEVDGVYIGATPIQVTLKEGVHLMKISKRGFLSWEHAIKAYNGLYVNAKLVTESTRKGDITESASAK
ncbi:hypothetical protein MNBD_NITROSPINAE02-815 [hydrothermal vent metagenome]|uniref:PEGA domain-containing protein n=1 Tax=hydrothermal vent metagenome TaxID=652676 RepID=A0A3B1C0X9_9ZZZZ